MNYLFLRKIWETFIFGGFTGRKDNHTQAQILLSGQIRAAAKDR